MHGLGAFATQPIASGTRLIEYAGARMTPDEADERYPKLIGECKTEYDAAVARAFWLNR